ncbi:MAG: hypothetical protein Kow00108_06600 [Calditrichia bacterium]
MNLNFYDQNGKVRAELLDKEAEELAKKLVKKVQAGNRKKLVGVSKHQFRRIFDEFKRLDKVLKEKNNWDEVLPLIKLIRSKVAYSVARLKPTNTRYEDSRTESECYEFYQKFLFQLINNINTEEDFRTALLVLEAVYGFYYQYGGVNKE